MKVPDNMQVPKNPPKIDTSRDSVYVPMPITNPAKEVEARVALQDLPVSSKASDKPELENPPTKEKSAPKTIPDNEVKEIQKESSKLWKAACVAGNIGKGLGFGTLGVLTTLLSFVTAPVAMGIHYAFLSETKFGTSIEGQSQYDRAFNFSFLLSDKCVDIAEESFGKVFGNKPEK